MRSATAVLGALWLAGLAIFLVMAVLAAGNDTFPGDVWLARRIQDLDWQPFAILLDWAEELAEMPLLALAVFVAALFFLAVAGWLRGLLMIAPLVLHPLNAAAKELVERPRPSPELVAVQAQPDSFSFPSGHAQAALLVYGLVFYLGSAYLVDWRIRLPLQTFCLGVITLTGIERVFVGHHWPSDVLGGFLFAALLLAAIVAFEKLIVSRPAGETPCRTTCVREGAPESG
jgi:undecaprenyl-diphosphatase